MRMHTLLLNPPSYGGFDGGAGSRYQARREIRSFWYPTWLAYPAGLIPRSRLLDAPADGLNADSVVRLAAEFDLVVMSTSTPTAAYDAGLAERLKRVYPRLRVGLVGPHTMVLPRETMMLSTAVDFVTTGEFDHAVAEIAAGVPYAEVDGIVFRSGRELIRTPDRPPVDNLDDLPFASSVYSRDLTIENYFIGYLQHPYVSFYTGRGCRSRCTYCLWPQTISGHAYRVRSPENVYREALLAKRLFPQVKEFFFDDDTFTDDPERAKEIARRIKPLGITWSCNARATVSKATLAALKDCGLRLLVVGFESGNQKILNGIRKGITTDRARQFMREARELGILVHGTFILGLPGETAETIEETIRYAIELDPYSLQVSLLAPYPGTEVYKQGVREGWIEPARAQLVRDGIQTAVMSYRDLSRADR